MTINVLHDNVMYANTSGILGKKISNVSKLVKNKHVAMMFCLGVPDDATKQNILTGITSLLVDSANKKLDTIVIDPDFYKALGLQPRRNLFIAMTRDQVWRLMTNEDNAIMTKLKPDDSYYRGNEGSYFYMMLRISATREEAMENVNLVNSAHIGNIKFVEACSLEEM